MSVRNPEWNRKYQRSEKGKATSRRSYLKRTEGKVKRQTGATKDRKKYEFERGLRRQYGITPFDYEFMLVQCEGKCPVCHRSWGWNGKRNSRPCIDHDHETGEVRGILCGYCNIAEGFLGSSDAAVRLSEYMLFHKGDAKVAAIGGME